MSSRITSFVSHLPKKHIVRVGRLLGLFAYILDRRHRRIVRRNLRFIYPQWSRDRVRQVSMRVFQNAGVTILEICQMTCLSSKDILNRVRIRGKENLFNAMKSPQGAIIISAHLGNWEMSALCASCYLNKPLVAPAREIFPKTLDRWMRALRTRFGTILLDKKRALPMMARMLRQGNVLGLLIDQGTKFSEGIEVTFLGKTVTATPAAAILARRYNSPVLPGFCVREGDNSLTLIVKPPLSLQKTKDSRADLRVNTQIMTDAIEEAVRAYPEQWFWFHKRWKRHYPHLYPEDMAKRQHRRKKRLARLKNA
jgi:KDO2-lipid IV(A) lauroyltransferase